MANNFFSKNYEVLTIYKAIDIFNKYTGLSQNSNGYSSKICYALRIFVIIAIIWELLDIFTAFPTSKLFFYTVLSSHYVVFIVISLFFQISSLYRRNHFIEITKKFRDLQNNHKIYMSPKEVLAFYVLNFSCVIFIIFSASIRVFIRMLWYKFDSFWEIMKRVTFMTSEIICFSMQHFVILLFWNYLIIFQKHVRLMNATWKKSANTTLVKLVAKSEDNKNFG